jgi:hypothetical protein
MEGMMQHFARKLVALTLVIATALSACGGDDDGDGLDGPADPNQNSLAIPDVDTDDDGLIEIASLAQLDWVRNDLSGTSLTDHDGRVNSRGCATRGCNGYELAADLNFDTNGNGVADTGDTYYDYDGDGNNAGWLPIGGVSTPEEGEGDAFVASFDGNNRRISNFYINRPFASGIGLIGIAESRPDVPVAIRNVVIDGPLTSVRGFNSVGLLVGRVRAAGPTIIENNQVAGQVNTLGVYSGGMIGDIGVSDGELVLQGNESSASVTADGIFSTGTGSLIGALSATSAGQGSARISASHASGDVSGDEYMGGLIGQIDGRNIPVVVEDCSASGAVTGDSFYVGGLAGLVTGSNIRISRAQATGDVRVRFAFGAGGLIGSLQDFGTVTIEESLSSGAVTSPEGFAGGLIGIVFLDSGRADIHGTSSEGVLTAQDDDDGGPAGGLIGLVAGGPDGQLFLSSSYAAGAVSGSQKTGGLVGEIDIEGNAAVAMENVFAIGKVSADVLAGGLVGRTRARDTADVVVSNGYVINTIAADRDAGALGGFAEADPQGTVNFRNLYWATDTTAQLNSFGGITFPATAQGVHGSTLAGLSCPTGPDDTSCDDNELYNGWGEALNARGEPAWRFSTPGALPALRFGGVVYQPVYNASDGSFAVVRE